MLQLLIRDAVKPSCTTKPQPLHVVALKATPIARVGEFLFSCGTAECRGVDRSRSAPGTIETATIKRTIRIRSKSR
jgi:hypothetical protein